MGNIGVVLLLHSASYMKCGNDIIYKLVHIMILIVYVSTTGLITQGNYIGYMFRLLNSHLQAFFTG